eukprot:Colp12_sorted_trinity150504_noHs@34530
MAGSMSDLLSFGKKKEKKRDLKWYIHLFKFIAVWVGGGFGIASSWLSSPLWIFIIACIGMGFQICLFAYTWRMASYFPFSPYVHLHYLIHFELLDSTPRDKVISWITKFGLLLLGILAFVIPIVNIAVNIDSGKTSGVGLALAIAQIVLGATAVIILLFYYILLSMEIFFFFCWCFVWVCTRCCPCAKMVSTPTMSSPSKSPLYLIYLAFFKWF